MPPKGRKRKNKGPKKDPQSESQFSVGEEDCSVYSESEEFQSESQNKKAPKAKKGKKTKKIGKQGGKQGGKGLSLLGLTPLFIALINRQEGKILNINVAQKELGVQKRRIYDMTNSLQALNYLQKFGKSQVRWIDADERYIQEYKQLNKKIKDVKAEIKKYDPQWQSEGSDDESEMQEEEKSPHQREDLFSEDEDDEQICEKYIQQEFGPFDRESNSPKEEKTEKPKKKSNDNAKK